MSICVKEIMKRQMLKIMFILSCSIIYGVGSGLHCFPDRFEGFEHICEGESEFEDSICFDVLLHSIHFDMVEHGVAFDFAVAGRPMAWHPDAEGCSVVSAANTLPLRAPPLVG